MSQFNERSQAKYIGKIRAFLDMSGNVFQTVINSAAKGNDRRGKRKYPMAVIESLESLANSKAARCEANDSSFAERYCIARDYCGQSDGKVAQGLGLSRETCRKWKIGLSQPLDMADLAVVLNVPLKWLSAGGEACLPANSHLGVRLGNEALKYREMLYGATLPLLLELDDDAPENEVQVFIDHVVMTHQPLAVLARRAGGRWQISQGQLEFAPWVYVIDAEAGLVRRFWTDEVEDIINEELATKNSVYAAWQSLAYRCSEKGLEFPQKITLYKRLDRLRKLKEKFGVYVPCQNNLVTGN